jgi:putative ABC transport system substrate-binding protein
MKRREFITLLGGAAAAWPLAARAQEPGRTYRLGVLAIGARQQSPPQVAFFDELQLSGFIEGQNLAVLPDGFGVPVNQLAARAAAMVRLAPDVLVGVGELATRALQQETQTIPIVGSAEDMRAAGLVASPARPDGNLTGQSLLSPELDRKRLDILIEAVPTARRMVALADTTQTPAVHTKALQDAARERGVELSVVGYARREDIASALDAVKASGAQALNALASPLLPPDRVIERMLELRIPAIYQWPETAENGGFAAYGPRVVIWYRERARMVVKILRGVKPADLPVEQPSQLELVINLKAAKAIGHEVPAGLVLRADKVIE